MSGGFFARLFGVSPLHGEMGQAVDRAVDQVEPLLRQVSGYPDAYLGPVARALAHARKLAAEIPGPIVIDREHYASDPIVHAVFGSPEAVQAALCASKSMREFVAAHPHGTQVYALMGMRRWVRETLGMALEGDRLRRDVPQTLVYFSDHTIAQPAGSEAESREHLAWEMFDSLVGHVRQHILDRKLARAELERARDMLKARLHTAAAPQAEVMQQQLAELAPRIEAITSDLDLRRYAEVFENVLGEPEQHLYLEQIQMALDSLGVRREEGAAPDVHSVHFVDLHGRDRRRWTVTMVRCENLVRPSLSEEMEKATRWLEI